jgi:hypothetical protein
MTEISVPVTAFVDSRVNLVLKNTTLFGFDLYGAALDLSDWASLKVT